MPSTEDRVRSLVKEKLEMDLDENLEARFSDLGVSSVDAIDFLRVINKEFNITIPTEDIAQLQTLGELVAYLDAHAG